MLSFEISAIDVILVLAVVVLLIIQMKSFANSPERLFSKSLKKEKQKEKKGIKPIESFAECPRGFGNIKLIESDNSVSERCLGCYKIMECYNEKVNI